MDHSSSRFFGIFCEFCNYRSKVRKKKCIIEGVMKMREEKNMENRIVVYTSEGCPYCDRVKEILMEHGVVFKEKNISLNERHYKEWKAKEHAGTPITYYKESFVVGVHKKQLLELIEMYKENSVVNEQ